VSDRVWNNLTGDSDSFWGHREDALPSWEGGGGGGGGGGLAWETWKQSATVAQSKTSGSGVGLVVWGNGMNGARSWAADTVSVETERSRYRSHPARGPSYSIVRDMHGTAGGLVKL
jgi:hypothetical protein